MGGVHLILKSRSEKLKIDAWEMSYVSFGKGEKNLVLIPGLSESVITLEGKAFALAMLYRQFAKKYKVYIFSKRKHIPEIFSIRDMARDQARALKALGIDKTSVIGVSQGGMIAQYLAIDRPELIDKLVLAVTAPAINPVIEENINRCMELVRSNDYKKYLIETVENSYSHKSLWKYRLMYPFIGLFQKPSNLTRLLASCRTILDFDASSELYKITCPTLIIAGAKDRIVGLEASHQLHEGIKNSRLYVYEEFGHAAHEEAKDFNTKVLEFLE